MCQEGREGNGEGRLGLQDGIGKNEGKAKGCVAGSEIDREKKTCERYLYNVRHPTPNEMIH